MKKLTFSKVLAYVGLTKNRKSGRDWMIRGAVVMTTLSMVLALLTPVAFAEQNSNGNGNNNSNNDKGKLTLIKQVVGGESEVSDWTLTATGPDTISGTTGNNNVKNKQVKVGTYTLSESGGPNNYEASDWTCTRKNGNQTVSVPVTNGNQVTVTKDKEITCTVVNTYVAPDPEPDPCDLQSKNPNHDDEDQDQEEDDDCGEPCDFPNIVNRDGDCEEPERLDVTIEKVWQTAGGQPLPAPSNSGDITIRVESSTDDETCDYNQEGDFGKVNNEDDGCKIRFMEGSNIEVTETGIPAGWEVDPATVGNDIVPICSDHEEDEEDNDHEDDDADEDDAQNLNFRNGGDHDDDDDDDEDHDDDKSDCTHTVINKLKTASVCNTELVLNGGFELPEVVVSDKWDIFQSGSVGMGWSVEWVRNTGNRPFPANMELHEGVNGWNAHGGNQYTELDSDWGGPSSSQSGEDASVKLYQDLITKVGSTYTVSFWTSPRPSISAGDNKIQVKVGSVDEVVNEVAGGSNTTWTEHTYSFVATEGVTRLEFIDIGTGNSLGGFLDDVSVKEECLSDVTICKYDDSKDRNPLSGWTVFLKGDKLETVVVDSAVMAGANSTTVLESGQSYLVKAKGTWQNRGNENVDARFTTANSWSTAEEAPYGGFPDNLLELQVNSNFVDWSAYSSTHEYDVIVSGTGAVANFGVFDGDVNTNTQNPGWFGDNIGSLTVDIYPVYSGVTGEDGCVILENVPYDTYKLEEIMQDGWEDVSGKGTSVTINDPIETPTEDEDHNLTLVNECVSEECRVTIPQLHLIKVVCDSFSDVAGNESADEYDETADENYTAFSNYMEGAFSPSPLVNGFVNPSEIPSTEAGCERTSNWSFTLSSDQDQETNLQTATTGVDGEYVTPISGEGSTLIPALQTAIVSGEMWVSENTQAGYDFAAIRCYNDALYGDNLEYISLGEAEPANIYCIAYNIEQVRPCVADPITIVSGEGTEFLALREGSAPSDLKDASTYGSGTPGAAVPVGPTGYPGAWDGADNETDVDGAVFVSNDVIQPTNPGGPGYNGLVDSYRLFSRTFEIPAGATSISSPMIHFAADNEVTVYLDDVLVGNTASFSATADMALPSALTPGVHVLKFAVKNYAFQPTNNPTGVIFKLDTITYSCPEGGDDRGTTVHGLVYGDDNTNNNQDEPEGPIAGMLVKLFEASADGEDDGTDLDETEVGSDVSDVTGYYEFLNVPDGCYIVREIPEGYVQTEPDVTSHEYYINVGNVDCDFTDFEETILGNLFFKTAKAASSTTVFALYTGQSLKFGNYDDSNGGSSTSSGSGRKTGGRILGDTTTIPSTPPGQVLGASTLPVTGSPAWMLLVLALVAAPLGYFRKLAIQKK